VGEALEVAEPDLGTLGGEPRMRQWLGVGAADVAGGVVEIKTQAGPELAELPGLAGWSGTRDGPGT
jgi:hypothetical protein